ncbi:MAG TPA: lytic transglycosylase, partial [bacterium]|nr:lytic transglycosylase [bacterium]
MRASMIRLRFRQWKNATAIILLCFLFSYPPLFGFDEDLFPVPEILKPNVNFWVNIFTLYHSNQVVIHDADDVTVVYAVVDYDARFIDLEENPRQKWDRVDEVKQKYLDILLLLAESDSINPMLFSARHRYVYNLFLPDATPQRFRRAAKNIRGQQGLRDRFREALIRSGRYMYHIEQVFDQHGLPLELSALPFVESLFNYKAYSKVGAAGIWQFT